MLGKFENFLSTEAKRVIMDADLDTPVRETLHQLAAGKGNAAKKNDLIRAGQFMMKNLGWLTDIQTNPDQSDKKPFTCSKCDSEFLVESDAAICCDEKLDQSEETERVDEKASPGTLENAQSTEISDASNVTKDSSDEVSPEPGTSKDSTDHPRTFKCQNCDENVLIDHVLTHQCNDDKPFSCTECDGNFKNKSDLEKHVKKHKEKSFNCQTCDKKFKNLNELKKHEKVHKTVACADCDKKVPEPSNFNSEKPFRCSECNKKFKQNNPVICEFYRAGHCKFGPKGQNKIGKCYNKHPEPCQKFSDGQCKDKKCAFMHTAPVCTFFLKQKCQRKHCKFTHPKPPKKPSNSEEKSESEKNPSDAPIAKRDSKEEDENGNMKSFLEEFTRLQKRLDQRDQLFQERFDKMEKRMERDSNSLTQHTAFPPLWPAGQVSQNQMHPVPQNLQIQTLQPRLV